MTFVFTDIVGSTRLKAILGEEDGVARIQMHHAEVRRLLAEFHEAEEVRTSGDSFLIVFAEPADAVAFALRLQAALSRKADGNLAVRDRIGIHRGEAVVQEGKGFKELLGSDVDVCARVMSLADGDQILLTRSTLGVARAGFAERWPGLAERVRWMDHGRFYLKGFPGAREIGEVGEPGRSRLASPGGMWRSVRGRWRIFGIMLCLALATVVMGPRLTERWFKVGPMKTRVVAVLPNHAQTGTNIQRLLDGVLLAATESLAGASSTTSERVRVVQYADLVEEKVTSPSDARWQFGATQVILATLVTNGGRWEIRLTEDNLEAGWEVKPSAILAEVGELRELSGRLAARVASIAALRLVPTSSASREGPSRPDDMAMGWYLTGLGILAERLTPSEGAAEAVDLLQRAVGRDPSLAEAFAALGEAYWREFRRTHARTNLEAGFRAVLNAIELSNGALPAAHFSLGCLRREVGESREAVRAFHRALALQPNHPSASRVLASVYATLGERTKAEQTLLDGTTADPDNWRAHNALGAFYSDRPETWPAAASAFRRAAELAPANHLVWANLGGMLVFVAVSSEGADGVALEAECRAALDRSIRLRPTSGAWSNRGSLDFFTGRFPSAVTCFEEALRLDSDDLVLWGNLGDAARHVPSDAARARDAHRRAIELTASLLAVNPRRMDLVATLAALHAQLGELERARTYANQVEDPGALDIGSQMYMALAWESLGERDRALAIVHAAVVDGHSPRLFLRHPDLEALGRAAIEGRSGVGRSVP